MENFFNSKISRLWCVYEWFYPTIDCSYFNHNEFQDCLNELGLGKVNKKCCNHYKIAIILDNKAYENRMVICPKCDGKT
jgi:hypothetical protein